MTLRLLTFVLILLQLEITAQSDSIWNVMILKKGYQPVIKENMAHYSPTGFYLFRNCFYDLKFRDKTVRTLKLVDIEPDTLVFTGISPGNDSVLPIPDRDTLRIDYRRLSKILLLKDWVAETSSKVKCDNHYFIFYKSLSDNRLENKYDFVLPDRAKKSELIPRLSSYGITYHFENEGKLYYITGIKPDIPVYSDEDRLKAMNLTLNALNLIVNKQLNIKVYKQRKVKGE